MNELALELNKTLEKTIVSGLLSDFGKRFFFPKGIVSQTEEAKQHARRFNATLGMAYNNGEPIYIPAIRHFIPELSPNDIFPYSSTTGEPLLRGLWEKEMILKNPELKGKSMSKPVVVSGITNGLAVLADLFVDEGDPVIVPDMFWGNYRLIFEARRQAKIFTYPFFTEHSRLNISGLQETIKEQAGKGSGKVIILLNFPNNPTGYTPSREEVQEIVRILEDEADKGTKMIVIMDDAYFGLFFEEETYKHSLFAPLSSIHKNILAVKLDGATKENMAWGFRIGFITFASRDLTGEHYEALIKKVMGTVRASISNCSKLAQSLLIKGMQHTSYKKDKQKAFELIKEKYLKVREILENTELPACLKYLPFNSGYFMCFELKSGSSEELRRKLLYEHGIGTISIDDKYLRVAFSNIDKQNLEELYHTIIKLACTFI